VDLALPYRPFQTRSPDLELFTALEQPLRCRDPELQRIPAKDETAAAFLYAGDPLVNALQTRAEVVLQKSLREGFGLTVAEAMWKGTPVIGGNVGGIRYQIEDGVNGFLVSSIEEAADRIVRLLKNKRLRDRMGKNGRQTVREKFLLTRYVEQYFDLFRTFPNGFRTRRVS
jgi:glycosyltransferase involved in cell wall biosynthesis